MLLITDYSYYMFGRTSYSSLENKIVVLILHDWQSAIEYIDHIFIMFNRQSMYIIAEGLLVNFILCVFTVHLFMFLTK